MRLTVTELRRMIGEFNELKQVNRDKMQQALITKDMVKYEDYKTIAYINYTRVNLLAMLLEKYEIDRQ